MDRRIELGTLNVRVYTQSRHRPNALFVNINIPPRVAVDTSWYAVDYPSEGKPTKTAAVGYYSSLRLVVISPPNSAPATLSPDIEALYRVRKNYRRTEMNLPYEVANDLGLGRHPYAYAHLTELPDRIFLAPLPDLRDAASMVTPTPERELRLFDQAIAYRQHARAVDTLGAVITRNAFVTKFSQVLPPGVAAA